MAGNWGARYYHQARCCLWVVDWQKGHLHSVQVDDLVADPSDRQPARGALRTIWIDCSIDYSAT
jgi:hypothetical protein